MRRPANTSCCRLCDKPVRLQCLHDAFYSVHLDISYTAAHCRNPTLLSNLITKNSVVSNENQQMDTYSLQKRTIHSHWPRFLTNDYLKVKLTSGLPIFMHFMSDSLSLKTLRSLLQTVDCFYMIYV